MKKLSTIVPPTLNSIKYTQSPIEAQLFQAMMKSGLFILCRETDEPCGAGFFLFPQMQVGPYRADFIIRACGFINHHKVWPPHLQTTLCVECDGEEFHSTEEQILYDKNRDAYFLEHGIKTLRFSGSKIHNNVNFIVDEIIHELDVGMKKKND